MQAGLYDEKDELIYTWEELIKEDIIEIKNNKDIELFLSKHGKKLIINDNIEGINEFAFYEDNIEEIIIPKSIKKIESDAFYNCDKLNKIIFLGNKKQFEQIKYWRNIFGNNSKLSIENIEFRESLEDLLDMGYSIREANKIIKEQEER